MRASAVHIFLILFLLRSFVTTVVKGIKEDLSVVNKSLDGHLKNKSSMKLDNTNAISSGVLGITSNEKGKQILEERLLDDDSYNGSENEQGDFEDDFDGDVDNESFSSRHTWNIFGFDEDEDSLIDEDQVDPPVSYTDEGEATSMTPMEDDLFDYIESLAQYDVYDSEDSSDLVDDSLISTTLSSSRSITSTECSGDSKDRKKTKKKKRGKGKNSPVQIMTVGKMGKGKLMSRWQKNCCIRGRRVGNARRTFLSSNLFQECKDRTRSLRSRMSRSCKWIFWSCCEAKALRRFYSFTKSRKRSVCS